ncbi:MAG: ergothioneine biosynthesis protein EgtC [Streptomycetaceae bacterium]|nr:ergothioneine biosynthesis protein EgtC [Streptomycetaceae bacterium]
MCRHISYLGPETTLRQVLTEPPYSLYRQSWAPRRQRHGTVNADGFGVGWYAPGDPVPARYRRTGPVWADPSFLDLARVVRTGALLAAVRDTTEGSASDESAVAPYSSGPWLFSHNGSLPGWPDSVVQLAADLPPQDLLRIEARCDAALIWALVLHRLRGGQPPGEALAGTVTAIASLVPACLNLLLTDGHTIAAIAWGDTLWHRTQAGRSVAVASEPYDDGPGWTEIPDQAVFLATREGIDITSLKESG